MFKNQTAAKYTKMARDKRKWEIKEDENDDEQERHVVGAIDRHGWQGVSLEVLEMHTNARERPYKGVCGKLPV